MNQWTQREIVVVAAIGAVFGVVYLAWVQLWLMSQALIGPLSLDLFFVSCPRIFWTPICPTGGIHDEVEHDPNRNHRCE